jgi:pyruvate kinase
MYEISSVIGGQMSSGLRINESNNQTRGMTAVEQNFINVAKSLAASQIVVTERSQTAELALRKKPEAEIGLPRTEEKEEDIFDMIAKVEAFLKKQKGE